MLTKKQKNKVIESGISSLDKSHSVVFIDFTGVKTGDINAFRRTVKSMGGEMAVIKKKLLRIAFEKKGLDFDPEQFESQVGTVFAPTELYAVAAPAYKFKEAKILGGYDIDAKRFASAEEVIMLGKLPSKEVLLGQLVGMLAAPIRSFMFVLNERSRQSA